MQLGEQYTVVGVVITEAKNIVHMVFHLHADTIIYDIPNLETLATKAEETAAISWLRFSSGQKCLVCFQQTPQTKFQGMYSSGFLFICKLLYDS